MKKLVMISAVSFAVVAAQAAVVPLVNGDFESYTGVAPGTAQVRGLTDGVNQSDSSLSTLVGWSQGAGSTWVDSGTEFGGYNPTGSRNLYLMGEDGVAQQTTSYVIGSTFGAGEILEVSMLMGDIWEWAYARVELYYDDPANVISTYDTYSDFAGTGWWSTMSELKFWVPASEVALGTGGNLGISIQNMGDIYLPDPGINGTWMAVDNVQIKAIPEPATIGLLGIAGIGMLFARRHMRI